MTADAAARYQRFFEGLNPTTVGDLRQLAAPDMRFVDPFNDVTGVGKVIKVLAAGFEDAEDLRFEFADRAAGRPGVWYYRWRCSFRPRSLSGEWVLEGMSEVSFDAEGRVVEHLDHWDSGSQFYARIPVLRWFIGLIRRRLRVD
ncbi:MAG: nuclear transport factor 2 family protein [Alphaproteobacteria bacterium]